MERQECRVRPHAVKVSVIGGVSALALLLSAGVAMAQEDAGSVSEVVVTGSRIVRDGFAAPTPVTVVGAERMEQRAISNVGELLNELPSFRASTTPATQQLAGGNVGARILDLRGLGAPRTLVLVDGKRFVPSTPQGTLDINLIPSILVERTEVVTGGASAAYGSDAVAGVVNFILNDRLKGLKAVVEYGSSQRGDDRNGRFGLAGGTDFAGGRGHFIAGGEYQKEKGMGDCYVRDWCGSQVLNLANTPAGSGGLPANNILPNVNNATFSQDGVINGTTLANPLRGITFNQDGGTRPFQYGTLFGSNLAPIFMLGGEGTGENTFIQGFLLKVPVERYTTYGRATYDITPSITGALDVSYGRVKGTVLSSQYRDSAGSLANAQSYGPIRSGNPFIPATVQAIMNANNIANFTLGRSFGDIGNARATAENETFRVVASLKGKLFDTWTWDAYYQYGDNKFRQDSSNNVVPLKMRNAIDAVRNAAGSIVCAINADAITTNDDAACAPFNAFGRNRFSSAAKAYVTADGFQTTNRTEHIVAANLQGELFNTWAGPVSIAGGGEYRTDTLSGDADAISRQNGFFVLNGQAFAGKVSVTEGYVEAVVPLAKDLPFAKTLELNGAARRTHYSRSSPGTADSSVNATTWKIGAVWAPVDELRFRLTRSRDIRAPNIAELFGPQTLGGTALSDPALGGRQAAPRVQSGSNAALVPEIADTWTAGVVFRPDVSFLRNFQLSVDYYDIKVDQAIGTVGAVTIVTRCFQGAQEFCPLVSRDPVSQEVTLVRDVLLNVNGLVTKGFDIEASYRLPLNNYGELNFRALATIVKDLITVDSAGATNRAGYTGWRAGSQPGIPDYILDGLVTWNFGRGSITAHGKYIPEGKYNNLFLGPDEPGYSITNVASSNLNTVAGRAYFDLSAQYRLVDVPGKRVELFGAVNNLLDSDPPAAPSGSGNGNFILFDPVGRAFKVGLRMTY